MFKKIIKVSGQGANEIEVKVAYSLGGMNYFTGRVEPRGYYLHVTPRFYKVSDSGFACYEYAAFSGIKALVKEVARKSNKAEKEADELGQKKMDMLVMEVIEKNGLTVEA